MENFLTPILDSWSKYKAEKLVILGNGESRSNGQDFAKQESLPVVSINTHDLRNGYSSRLRNHRLVALPNRYGPGVRGLLVRRPASIYSLQ